MNKSLKNTLIVVCVLVIVVAAGVGVFFAYVNNYYRADEDALNAMESTSLVQVSQKDGYVEFMPTGEVKGAFVFIPGGRVEAIAYAPLMQEIANNGVLCILLQVKYNLAVMDQDAPKGIKDNYQGIDAWVIGGHSLGGTIASKYLAKHPDEYSGIVFLGSYADDDLSSLDIGCYLIYGSNDEVMKMGKYEAAKAKLPANYSEYIIDGGNHSQFGSYALQKGDGEASISKQLQWSIVAQLLCPPQLFLQP